MKILLVDEDRAALDALIDALKAREDLELSAAESAKEAFDAAGDLDGLDVLITAALMAPQDGFHLSSALRARHPGLRVAYLSKTDLRRHYGKVGDDIVFYKPVDTAVLIRWLDGPNDAVRERGGSMSPGPAEDGGAGARKGSRIGDYELLRLLHATDRTEIYEAMQRSVRRRVAFTMLRDEVRRTDESAERAFLEEVRAKASVVHQHIAPVYEAHEEDEAIFYTRELLEGPDLASLTRAGVQMMPRTITSLVRVVAESLEYLHQREMRFSRLNPQHIFLGSDDQARLLNIAVAGEDGDERSQVEQIRAFAEMITPVAGLREQSAERKLVSQLLYMMNHEKDHEVNGSWAALRVAAQAVELELEKGTNLELPAVESKVKRAAAKRVMTRLAIVAACIIALAVILKGVAVMLTRFDRPEARSFDKMVRIPGGRFHYQDGAGDHELEAFWIDEYEVTIAQYAEFLEALASDPSMEDALNHPDRPESKKSHEPADWKECYRAARRGGYFKGQQIDLNYPVTLVDWWDAYAYARWKGHRLPTEEEWEKAARGREGKVYPWGNEFVAANLNSGEDYSADPGDGTAGAVDGFVLWSPVDAVGADVSDYAVKGMAGNVSEWTATWTNHPEFPDRQVPVKRGGSFATTSGYELDIRRPANSPEEKSLTLGFRTASSARPADAAIEE